MNKQQKFTQFVKSLQNTENKSLIENIIKGFNAINEAYDYNDDEYKDTLNRETDYYNNGSDEAEADIDMDVVDNCDDMIHNAIERLEKTVSAIEKYSGRLEQLGEDADSLDSDGVSVSQNAHYKFLSWGTEAILFLTSTIEEVFNTLLDKGDDYSGYIHQFKNTIMKYLSDNQFRLQDTIDMGYTQSDYRSGEAFEMAKDAMKLNGNYRKLYKIFTYNLREDSTTF